MVPYLKEGEHYAGMILGDNPYHLVLLPAKPDKLMPWDDAKKWAKTASGRLPTRREQSLLLINLKEQFEPFWHWSCDQVDSDPFYAWMQGFLHVRQDYFHKSYEGRARAVRRVYLEAT
jgi:hypothetical protein